ncbi:hypothetical protein H257_09977 [Aphanomyces astaci]|uniref:Uncharacterized protein n=1 Tax=Aphanomyces astaci TaxID=112090 RepID=W4GAE0_APHAT|nr:hypothetical protein H257_09977 [Aphanomyces astaci]ETV76034.1 hypothetical protein H257_09977 [Aphanomyces astaci]|eukprot:XP_009834676.1 hypothetical protein H257_09977 [Aphanomyces astaci]
MVWRGLFRALGSATGVKLVSAASWNDLGALKMLHWATGGPSWTTSFAAFEPLLYPLLLSRWVFLGHILRWPIDAPAYKFMLRYFSFSVAEPWPDRPITSLHRVLNAAEQIVTACPTIPQHSDV